jgi:predicted TIM-barrel fold metal-dependent hydrolase
MKRQMWFATQPLEEPENPKHLVEQIHQCGGADRIMFASDWPHHDFDHPKAIMKLPMPMELKRAVMGENALKAFTRIPAPVAAVAAD